MNQKKDIVIDDLSRDELIDFAIKEFGLKGYGSVAIILQRQFGENREVWQRTSEITDHMLYAHLIEETGFGHKLTPIGREIYENGGWLKYLDSEKKRLELKKKREDIEMALAESNLIANARNEKHAKANRIGMYINIGLGIVNILLFVYSVFFNKT